MNNKTNNFATAVGKLAEQAKKTHKFSLLSPEERKRILLLGMASAIIIAPVSLLMAGLHLSAVRSSVEFIADSNDIHNGLNTVSSLPGLKAFHEGIKDIKAGTLGSHHAHQAEFAIATGFGTALVAIGSVLSSVPSLPKAFLPVGSTLLAVYDIHLARRAFHVLQHERQKKNDRAYWLADYLDQIKTCQNKIKVLDNRNETDLEQKQLLEQQKTHLKQQFVALHKASSVKQKNQFKTQYKSSFSTIFDHELEVALQSPVSLSERALATILLEDQKRIVNKKAINFVSKTATALSSTLFAASAILLVIGSVLPPILIVASVLAVIGVAITLGKVAFASYQFAAKEQHDRKIADSLMQEPVQNGQLIRETVLLKDDKTCHISQLTPEERIGYHLIMQMPCQGNENKSGVFKEYSESFFKKLCKQAWANRLQEKKQEAKKQLINEFVEEQAPELKDSTDSKKEVVENLSEKQKKTILQQQYSKHAHFCLFDIFRRRSQTDGLSNDTPNQTPNVVV